MVIAISASMQRTFEDEDDSRQMSHPITPSSEKGIPSLSSFLISATLAAPLLRDMVVLVAMASHFSFHVLYIYTSPSCLFGPVLARTLPSRPASLPRLLHRI